MTPASPRSALLVLPSGAADELARRARAAWPREACGILLGTRSAEGPDAVARVTAVVPAANVTAASPGTSFEIDPGALVAACARAEREGLAVVGFWHSHPDRPAEPSASDRRAAWPAVDHLIVPVTRSGAGAPRAWRSGPRGTAEMREIEVTGGRGSMRSGTPAQAGPPSR